MTTRNHTRRAFRLVLLATLVAFQCAAAGGARQAPRAQPEQARAPVPMPRAIVVHSDGTLSGGGLSGLPGGGTQTKLSFSSTDAKGDCPSGATKIERCSGVYANGTSWEIAPCCRTETN